MSYNPYQPSPYYDPRQDFKPDVAGQTPTVWIFYTLYCVGLALVYLACIIGGIVLLVIAPSIQKTDDRMAAFVFGGALSVISLPLMILFFVSPFLPRGKFAWIMGMVTICIGLTSGCTLVPCIILLIFWVQPDTKRYYGMN